MSERPWPKFLATWRRQHATAFLVIGLTLVLLHAAGEGTRLALRYDRVAIGGGELWRIFTAHLVHLDLQHLLMNLAGLWLLGSLYGGDARTRDWVVTALASALAIGIGLWFLTPSVAWYVGLSGVLHGVWAGGGVFCRRRWPLESTVTLALLAIKLVLEREYGALSAVFGVGLPVITSAHVYGAIGGAVAALALRLRRTPV